MKKILLFAPLLLLLTACPIEMDYAPGKAGSETVDSRLIGTWQISDQDLERDPEIVKVKISKKDKFSHQVEVLERGGMYALETDKLTLYETAINGLQIIYLQPEDSKKYYMYQVQISGNKAVIADVPLLDGGVDAVSSIESMRKQIESSMSKPEFYNSPFTYKKL